MNDTAVSLFRQSKQTKDGQTVQLNKGHFCLDTEERLQEFSQKLASDWNDEYEEYRRLWVELPASRTIRDYPLLLDLELASICNLKCPMCYTITDEFKQKVTKLVTAILILYLFGSIVEMKKVVIQATNQAIKA